MVSDASIYLGNPMRVAQIYRNVRHSGERGPIFIWQVTVIQLDPFAENFGFVFSTFVDGLRNASKYCIVVRSFGEGLVAWHTMTR